MSQFNTQSFAAKLKSVNQSVPSITTLSKFMQYQKAHAGAIADTWFNELSRSSGPEHQLALFYLANDALQALKKQGGGDAFVATFTRVLPAACAVIGSRGLANAAKVGRCISILQDRAVLPAAVCSRLLAALDDPESVIVNADGGDAGDDAEVAFLVATTARSGAPDGSRLLSSEGSGSTHSLDGSATPDFFATPGSDDSWSEGGPTPRPRRPRAHGSPVDDASANPTSVDSHRASSPLGLLETELLPFLAEPGSSSSSSGSSPAAPPLSASSLSEWDDPVLARAEVALLELDRAEVSSSVTGDAVRSHVADVLGGGVFCVEDALAKPEQAPAWLQALLTSRSSSSSDSGSGGGGGGIGGPQRALLLRCSTPFDPAPAIAFVSRYCSALRAELQARAALVDVLAGHVLPAQSVAAAEEDAAAVTRAQNVLSNIHALRKQLAEREVAAAAAASAAAAAVASKATAAAAAAATVALQPPPAASSHARSIDGAHGKRKRADSLEGSGSSGGGSPRSPMIEPEDASSAAAASNGARSPPVGGPTHTSSDELEGIAIVSNRAGRSGVVPSSAPLAAAAAAVPPSTSLHAVDGGGTRSGSGGSGDIGFASIARDVLRAATGGVSTHYAPPPQFSFAAGDVGTVGGGYAQAPMQQQQQQHLGQQQLQQQQPVVGSYFMLPQPQQLHQQQQQPIQLGGLPFLLQQLKPPQQQQPQFAFQSSTGGSSMMSLPPQQQLVQQLPHQQQQLVLQQPFVFGAPSAVGGNRMQPSQQQTQPFPSQPFQYQLHPNQQQMQQSTPQSWQLQQELMSVYGSGSSSGNMASVSTNFNFSSGGGGGGAQPMAGPYMSMTMPTGGDMGRHGGAAASPPAAAAVPPRSSGGWGGLAQVANAAASSALTTGGRPTHAQQSGAQQKQQQLQQQQQWHQQTHNQQLHQPAAQQPQFQFQFQTQQPHQQQLRPPPAWGSPTPLTAVQQQQLQHW